jgi:hypothetical protein
VWLTGEKTTTAGTDGLLSGEGRVGVAAADHLYTTAATEEMPSGRLTLGGVVVRAVLPSSASSPALPQPLPPPPAEPHASPPPSRVRHHRGFFPNLELDDLIPGIHRPE